MQGASGQEGVMCPRKKTHVLDKLHSGVSYGVVGHEFNVNDQQHILNEVSLNRNTQKRRLHTN